MTDCENMTLKNQMQILSVVALGAVCSWTCSACVSNNEAQSARDACVAEAEHEYMTKIFSCRDAGAGYEECNATYNLEATFERAQEDCR